MALGLDSDPARRPGAGLYVHLPFCAVRCSYCTFVSSTDLSLMPRMLAAIGLEAKRLPRPHRPLDSLYLGGGTPSLLAPELLEGLFAAISWCTQMSATAEVTLEANPDDVTAEKAACWRELGINRVSLGVQALDDRVLSVLERRHDAARALAAAACLSAAGFALSLDLMLGVPGLDEGIVETTLDQVIAVAPQHLSVYMLELDKPHALGKAMRADPTLAPDLDRAAAQYLQVGRRLLAAGFQHYEISSFCRPGYAARHNLRYWRQRPVLALGPAAHGQAGRRRWANTDDLGAYLLAIEGDGSPRAWSRRLSDGELIKERVMLGLRLARGVSVNAVRRVSEVEPGFASRLEDFLEAGLARLIADRVRLTPRGWLVSNELFEELW